MSKSVFEIKISNDKLDAFRERSRKACDDTDLIKDVLNKAFAKDCEVKRLRQEAETRKKRVHEKIGRIKKMEQTIKLDDKKVIIKRYRVRTTGREGKTLETSIPREAFEREARRHGLTSKEAVDKLVAVWRFNNFRGLHLSFEPTEKEAEKQ